MAAAELDHLIRLLARLPGLGPRSARRAALALLKRPDQLMRPLAEALIRAAATVRPCSACGNLDTEDPCSLCRDEGRDRSMICVVEEVEDLWALERGGSYPGLYHVLGGRLSALDGIGPEELGIERLRARVVSLGVAEVILATGATVEGQTTAHYVAERLAPTGVRLTRLAQGLPLGAEPSHLDDGTLQAALRARRPLD